MRFSLQDVKKHIQRRGGELRVSLHFLRPGEMRGGIERLVAYHEQLLGQAHRHFSMDEAHACIGDYRLAHCLVAALSAWYTWQHPYWDTVLERIGNDRLNEAGITSPVHLRLALYNYVNEQHAGFLGAEVRTEALQNFASMYGLAVPDLEYLLVLDSDDEALLVREAASSPTPEDVALLYNQWVFEAALFNASDVHFVIDCKAFVEVQLIKSEALSMPLAGVGTVIKRLCYLARKFGVYYDLTYDANPSLLHLTLYGPQEMTGAPQQYGVRLARLCRMLMGYGTAQGASVKQRPDNQGGREGHPYTTSKTNVGRNAQAGLVLALIKAEATLHFLQRSYRFVMDADLLKLLPSPTETRSAGMGLIGLSPAEDNKAIFDSSIEQSFAEAFTALANSHGADGWQLEREPEPLVVPVSPGGETSQAIFIPDFALTRGNRRIYLEILGYWTPAYRERKIQKLQQLKERRDIVLAIPVEAREGFSSMRTLFPVVEYAGQLSATELLKVLRGHYDDFAERVARIDRDQVRSRIVEEGLVPERACYGLLHCYRRSELSQAADRVTDERIAFTPGIGLYQIAWMERLRASFVEWLREQRESSGKGRALPLSEVLREGRARWPVLADCEDATLEALLALWPEVRIERSSIFEAIVGLTDDEATGHAIGMHAATSATQGQNNAGKVVRERRPAYKKREAGVQSADVKQGDLWD